MEKDKKIEKEMYATAIFILAVSFIGIMFLIGPRFSVTGAVVLDDIDIEGEFEYVEPEEVTRESALNSLLEAEKDLKELQSFNLSTLFIQDNLLMAKRFFIGGKNDYLAEAIQQEKDIDKIDYLESLQKVAKETPSYEVKKLNYSEVIRLTQLISFTKQRVYKILDTLSLVEDEIKNYQNENIDTSDVFRIFDKAKTSFNEERYEESESYLKEANLELKKAISEYERIKNMVQLSKGFLIRYWWQIILSVVVVVLITPTLVRNVRKARAEKRLDTLRLELETIDKLLKKAQQACFIDKKIPLDTYKIRVEKYNTKKTEIKHTIPVLEAIISGKQKKTKKMVKRKAILEIKR